MYYFILFLHISETLASHSAFYPTYISVVNLLQSLHFGGALNAKRRKFFWIVVSPSSPTCTLFYTDHLAVCYHLLLGMDSSIPLPSPGASVPYFRMNPSLHTYAFKTAISIICLVDNGRHTFVRNLFGAGSSNEGIGMFSFGLSWTLITQGNPLVWPLRTRTSGFYQMSKHLADHLHLPRYRNELVL